MVSLVRRWAYFLYGKMPPVPGHVRVGPFCCAGLRSSCTKGACSQHGRVATCLSAPIVFQPIAPLIFAALASDCPECMEKTHLEGGKAVVSI